MKFYCIEQHLKHITNILTFHSGNRSLQLSKYQLLTIIPGSNIRWSHILINRYEYEKVTNFVADVTLLSKFLPVHNLVPENMIFYFFLQSSHWNSLRKSKIVQVTCNGMRSKKSAWFSQQNYSLFQSGSKYQYIPWETAVRILSLKEAFFKTWTFWQNFL